MIMNKRIVITGIGIISPVGIGKEEFWRNLISGKSGVRKITKFNTDLFECKIAAEVPSFNPEEYNISKKEATKRLDPFCLYGLAATELALRDSRLNQNCIEDCIGAIIATGIGGLTSMEQQKERLNYLGPSKVSAFLVTNLMPNAICGNVSIKYNLRGPTFSVSSACASSTHAIISSIQTICTNDADIIISGGSEAAITQLSISGFTNMGALTTKYNDVPEKASRPFDKERNGFVIGEGAGIIILEELEHAVKRNAHIYAEIVGYGMSSDAHHITEPAIDGPVKSMELALKKADLNPNNIQYINAHGTSTPLNDKNETLAIKRVFGNHAKKIAISSTKSMTGHLLGAAGGIETIVCALSIQNKTIPPTINYEFPDPECDLDYVPNEAREVNLKAAMNNSFGFGGHNAVLVLKKYEN